MSKLNLTALIFALIIGISIIVAAYFYYLSRKEELSYKKDVETQKSVIEGQKLVQEESKKRQIQACMDDVNRRFQDAFSKARGLSNESYKILFNEKQNQIDNCYKLYQ